MTRAHYTRHQLIAMLISDVVSDIRFYDSCSTFSPAAAKEIAAERRAFVGAVFAQRHTVRIDRYGWPILKENA